MCMKKLFIILFCLLVYAQTEDSSAFALADFFCDVGQPGQNEVHIGALYIFMPLGRIILVRNNQDYCAIKFSKWWSENLSRQPSIFVSTGCDEYAMYESYYINDKSSDSTNNNWQIKKAKLSLPKPRGIGRLAFSFADNDIKCGNINVSWGGDGTTVCFLKSCHNSGDDNNEFAPTPWTDIKEVNLSDPRIKWFRVDNTRKLFNIPIDKLWEK
jgi:hypothetical protein